MKCVVGLGNPGKRYAATRHNVGFMVVDHYASRHQVRFKLQKAWRAEVAVVNDILLVKPQTYMNLSGEAVTQVLSYYGLDHDDLLVIHDDLALPPFTLRLRPAGGAGGHNGLKSIIAHLGTQAFKRMRLGIGATPSYMETSDYVLETFKKDEHEALKRLITRSTDALETWVSGTSFENTMTQYNEKTATPLD